MIETKLLYVPIDSIQLNTHKQEDLYYFGKLKMSIKKFGQIRPVIVSTTDLKTFRTLEGSKIVRVLKELGQPIVLAVVLVLNNTEFQLSEDMLSVLLGLDRFTIDYPKVTETVLESKLELEEVLTYLPMTYEEFAHLKSKLEDSREELIRAGKKVSSFEQTKLLL